MPNALEASRPGFRDRHDAGRQLGAALAHYRGDAPLVLGLPKGGVPVAFEIAGALDAPLDFWIARKLARPGRPECGIGALAEGGGSDLDPRATQELSPAALQAVVEQEGEELERGSARFRQGRPLPDVRGRTVILVDDGVATGGTVRAAIRAIRARGPRRLVLAVPVGPTGTLTTLSRDVDDLVCLISTGDLRSVGSWYDDFTQTTDEEVSDLLRRSRDRFEPPDDLIVDGLEEARPPHVKPSR
jgi:putative phosphoribosyl transferase